MVMMVMMVINIELSLLRFQIVSAVPLPCITCYASAFFRLLLAPMLLLSLGRLMKMIQKEIRADSLVVHLQPMAYLPIPSPSPLQLDPEDTQPTMAAKYPATSA